MRALRDIRISIPSQAVTVIALTLLWYLSWWLGLRAGKGFISNLHLFWGAAFFYAPIIAAVFSVIMLISHFRTGRSHRWLVYTAVLIATTPWICFPLFTR
jgi:hypothetical protein